MMNKYYTKFIYDVKQQYVKNSLRKKNQMRSPISCNILQLYLFAIVFSTGLYYSDSDVTSALVFVVVICPITERQLK